MSKIDDGGPAFQTVANNVMHSHGMTLRGWLAAHAPPCPENWVMPKELLRQVSRPQNSGTAYEAQWTEYYAARNHNNLMWEISWRLAYADAMLEMGKNK